jgi:hypothetical protein
VADQPKSLSRVLENPIFYAVGMVIGLIGWWFRYLEDGHFLIVLEAGLVGLVLWFQMRRAKA